MKHEGLPELTPAEIRMRKAYLKIFMTSLADFVSFETFKLNKVLAGNTADYISRFVNQVEADADLNLESELGAYGELREVKMRPTDGPKPAKPKPAAKPKRARAKPRTNGATPAVAGA